jgi:hypothetical protein
MTSAARSRSTARSVNRSASPGPPPIKAMLPGDVALDE